MTKKLKSKRAGSAKLTKEMQWNELGRAAVIFGLVPDTSKKSMFAVSAMLEARMKSGDVKKRKEGNAQSSPAWYSAKKA
jgi:hypothetical protein